MDSPLSLAYFTSNNAFCVMACIHSCSSLHTSLFLLLLPISPLVSIQFGEIDMETAYIERRETVK